MANFKHLKQQLNDLKEQNLHRSLVEISSTQGPEVRIENRQMHLFASNNYLNLANDPKILSAAHKAIDKYGYGSGASRLISGTMSIHSECEKSAAKYVQKQSALIFPSGWMANEAVIKTIPQKGDLLILDKLNHASIIDAAKSSPADFRTFRRDNRQRLEKLLSDTSYSRKYIITESVFSMDGDTADLKMLVELKNKYDAYLIVDEAHAFGCMGADGVGLAEKLGLIKDVDIFIATFSKAFAANGGLVAGPTEVMDYLINRGRAFIYTTAPSPVNAAVILKGLEIVKKSDDRRNRLEQNSFYLRENLNKMGFDTGNSTTHIIPVIIGSEERTLKISAYLQENGFYIPAIRPPTVPPNSSRLRISLQCDHSQEQIDELLKVLKEFDNIF